ncbi:MAG: hypothetical protein JWO56_786 [Acidobacteria bacterium]|nr:hypothetical protein [Acidobacteriota bacterium]
MSTWITIAAVVAVVILGWNLYRRFGSDRIAELNERRRATSKMVGRGELVDGNRHLAVALALTQSTFFYENSDMQASIDLQWVREIEYDTELATGTAIEGGKVLRLRSNSQTFEFVLPNDVVPRWHMMLPPRRAVELPPAAPAVLTSLAPLVATAP